MKPLTSSLFCALLLPLCARPALAQYVLDEEPLRTPDAELFRVHGASALGLASASVEVGAVEGPIVLPDLGREVFVAAVTSGEDRKVVVALDASGLPLDLRAALDADRELGRSRRGRVTRRLMEEVERGSLTDRHLVVAWLDAPELDDLRADHSELMATLEAAGPLDEVERAAHEQALLSAASDRIEPLTRAAAADFAALGLEVVHQDTLAPVVFLRADIDELGLLVADGRVRSLDYAGTEYEGRLDVATPEVRANSVWTASGGVTGVGAKVAVVEGGRACSVGSWLTVSTTRTGGGCTTHTTEVASCIASNHPVHKGVAPGATVISANGADFVPNSNDVTTQMPGSVAAINWAIGQGAHILNLSYGAGNPGSSVSSFDRYLDYVARNYAKTIAIACGNSGNYAGDPGAGFNQLAVGAFDDRGSSSWSGETMASFSSWRNPVTGVETPQVAAPGVNLTMLTPSGSLGTSSGTSFSSPLTAGTAALLVAKQSALGYWPEAVRAITMATAWHNIEGATRLSSKDGAGGIDAKAAFYVARRGRGTGFNYGTLYASSFDSTGKFTAQTGFASAGQRVRVCLSWDATVTGDSAYTTDALMADLDLLVYSPSGALVASSSSGIQPFELVDFVAPQSGTYTVKIRRWTFTGSSEFWGTAFTTTSDM